MPLAEFVRQSIVDPNAVIAEGYQAGVMPQDFARDALTPEQLDALVGYLSGEGEGQRVTATVEERAAATATGHDAAAAAAGAGS